MKIPEKVTVGPREFTVEIVSKLLDETGFQKLNGHIMYDAALIKIDALLSYQSKRLTLMHEIVHGMADAVGVELDEKEVELMANILTATLDQNPILLDMFRKERDE